VTVVRRSVSDSCTTSYGPTPMLYQPYACPTMRWVSDILSLRHTAEPSSLVLRASPRCAWTHTRGQGMQVRAPHEDSLRTPWGLCWNSSLRNLDVVFLAFWVRNSHGVLTDSLQSLKRVLKESSRTHQGVFKDVWASVKSSLTVISSLLTISELSLDR